MVLMPALFPHGHPYRWNTIGEPSDLMAASFNDVRQFFSTYYHPGNASLVLAGDIDVVQGFDLVERYFGPIPKGPPRPAVDVPDTSVDCEQRLLLEDRVDLARVYLSWRSPALFGEGDAGLDLLATILTAGKSSRLYQRLVRDGQLALDVSAGQSSREIDGIFSIVATAVPGGALAEIEKVIADELYRLQNDGPTDDEVERSKMTVEADFAYRVQSLGDFGGRSDQLNAYNIYLDNPGYFDADLARYLQMDSAAIQALTQRYLTDERRVALSVIPEGADSSIGLPHSTRTVVG